MIEVCKIKLQPAFSQQLDRELQSLAERIHAMSRALVHRDFQSQNVMIRSGEPYLIDFRGCDLETLSTTWDPFSGSLCQFSDEELAELWHFTIS